MKKILNMRLLVVLTVFFALCSTMSTSASTRMDSLSLQFSFRFDNASLLRGYRNNDRSFELLSSLMRNRDLVSVDSVVVTGFSSPDGSRAYNDRLALARAQSVKTFFAWQYPRVSQSRIRLQLDPTNWSELYNLVERDFFCPDRDLILTFLRNPLSSVEKMDVFPTVMTPETSLYLQRNIYPHLRYVMGCVVYYSHVREEAKPQEAPAVVLPSVEEDEEEFAQPLRDTIIVVDTVYVPYAVHRTLIDSSRIARPKSLYSYKPLFALKTNLLFDAATLINVELEVPIGKRWSLAAEWIFPWWLWENSQHCLQMMSGNIEARYWFSPLVNRRGDERETLTGWFAGIYAGGGLYDLEYAGKGYQGEFFVAAGISAGFAHRIGRNLRMEYSLGVGYMQTNYRSYEAQKGSDDAWHLIRQQTGNYTWIGPTRAKVSFVWMLNRRVKKR